MAAKISEGARLLSEVTAPNTEIAEACGVSDVAVLYWRRGKKRPGLPMRSVLRDRYAIPVASWDRAAGTDAPPSRVVEPARGVETDPSDRLSSLPLADLIARTIDLWGEHAFAPADGIDLKTRVAAGVRLSDALDQRRALERDARAREADVVERSPQWAAIVVRLQSALSPHPDACRAVAVALRDLDRSTAPTITEDDA